MRKKIIYLLLLIPLMVWAAVTTITSGGNWNDPGIWSGGNIADNMSEDADMNNGIGTVTILNGDNYAISDLVMNNDNTLTIDAGGSLIIGSLGENHNITSSNTTTINVSGNLEIWGDLSASNFFVLNVTSSGVVIVHDNLNVLNDAIIDVQGMLSIEGDMIGGNNTDVNVDGTLNITGNINGGNNSDLSGTGTVNLGGTCTGPVSFCDSGPLGTATAAAGTDALVCYNTTYMLDATAANGTIFWTTSGDGTFDDSTLEDPVYTFGSGDITAGNAILTMTVTGNNTDFDDVVLTIDPEATAVAGTDVMVCFSAPHTLIAMATNSISIEWTTPGNGTFDDATLEDPVYTFGSADISAGTVTLTMTVTGNCNFPSDDVVLTKDPGSIELNDGIDNNCNGIIDEGFDNDGDGFSAGQGDCDDSNAAMYPGATEVNDGLDNNCDGNVDEGFDNDGDGYSTGQGDCDDFNAAINPGATEVNDGIDNNCDGDIDEGFDADGDGFSPAEGDCDDSNAVIYPGATEVNDGFDNNCDGSVDEGFDADGDGYSSGQGDCNDSDPDINPETIWYSDDDGDGFGDPNPNNSIKVCQQPENYVANNLDCNPTDPDIYPGAPALPDGKDNDCDGKVDKAAQTITLNPIPDQVDDRGSVAVEVSSTSGLDAGLKIGGPANLINGLLVLTGAGKVTVTATQPGDNRYLAAVPVLISFCVNPLPLISIFAEGANVLTLQSNYEAGNQWSLNGSRIESATELHYIVDASGDYRVEVAIDGCTGISDVFNALLTQVDLLAQRSVSLFPNPANQYLNIKLSNAENGKISEVFIFNTNGSLQMEKTLIHNAGTYEMGINVSELKSGIYFIVIKNENEVIRKRFSKQ